ncbi:PREDICTED: uncharacterized protein LOC107101878 [Cyprinodon variegatus]|uniref:uncharacterized protein LOC107101878 n=1 Tax=Cyprinodon variegatus TaxID=28743 RepID=UPI00074283A1|nr:PREDICTED: uncharacterized protein LOC107101878 [Cyprinodon variegatus]
MQDRGLYNKHSRDHKLIRDYARYLHIDRQVENYTQDVDNVARYLYYMDPNEPSLHFVLNKEKTQQYLRDLTEAGLMKQTQINYLKNLKCFLKFHTYHTDLKKKDPDLHGHCVDFIEFLGLQQGTCAKQVSKEVVRKRHGALSTDSQRAPKECHGVLETAKKDFLAVISKVFPDETQLSPQEITFVVYYLEALITLKHLQRVGVVKHMTVEEWIKRRKTDDGHTVVGVMEHKTAAQQVAMFALDQEEEMWCDTYYTRIRPQIFRSKRCVADQDRGRFFLSLKGTPIYNPSNDIRRLHEKYELEPVTNQEARRVYETAMKTKTDSERNLVADYLTHSNITAERHYRMKLPENIVRGRHLIDFAAGDSR